uniref:Transposase-associated domain-containing protein n=1 Tax=Tanacetum cinerariifolium TaxID=118510 RepID=A0A6L2KVY2_TANCI|nr:hypothetical protein [Tanacetum cinerariifolium]
MMPCPCTICLNHIEHKVEEVQFHLFKYGIDLSYTKWDKHGENDEQATNSQILVNAITEFVDDTDFDMDFDAEKPLYKGCPDFTKLSVIVKLLDLTGKYGASDKFFTELLGLLKKMIPAEPLVDDLHTLFETGVDTYDTSIKENFNLRVVMLWTINDYHALGTLCGCPYSGFKEKNVYESLVRTLLNVPGKTKDGMNARLDLAELGKNQSCLLGHVQNRNRPDGCIAEETNAEKTIEFFSEYQKTMKTIGIPLDKHVTNENEDGKPLSADKSSEVSREVFQKAHLRHKQVLKTKNPSKQIALLENENSKSFAKWLREEVERELVIYKDSVSKIIRWISYGPRATIVKYEAYNINGYTFCMKSNDVTVYQNSGVIVEAIDLHIFKEVATKRKAFYYGVLQEIWEDSLLNTINGSLWWRLHSIVKVPMDIMVVNAQHLQTKVEKTSRDLHELVELTRDIVGRKCHLLWCPLNEEPPAKKLKVLLDYPIPALTPLNTVKHKYWQETLEIDKKMKKVRILTRHYDVTPTILLRRNIFKARRIRIQHYGVTIHKVFGGVEGNLDPVIFIVKRPIKCGNNRGLIIGMTPAQALSTIQTMADHSLKWHDGTSNRSICSSSNTDGLAAIDDLNWDQRYEESCSENSPDYKPRPRDYTFREWMLIKVGHTNVNESVRKALLNLGSSIVSKKHCVLIKISRK